MYPYVALRGPTYRENSHANHTWHPQSHEIHCFEGSEEMPVWVRFPSPAPLFVVCVSLRCPRVRLSVSPSSHSLDAATSSLDRMRRSALRRVRSRWSHPSVDPNQPCAIGGFLVVQPFATVECLAGD
jgi:hypothetical protein